MVGRTFLHYQVLAPLGSGTFGQVFLGLDQHTGRHVALKFLADTLREESRSEDIQREARAASRLNHPGIVTVHGLEHADGEWFLIEEYVDGEDLDRRLRRGALGVAEVLRLAEQLTAALVHAHGLGVLHRDIKPANVLITATGDYKLADFGLARLEDATRSDSGRTKGTLSYMAPERLQGQCGDVRADLFSLGAVLYESTSGRRAFSGSHEAEIIYSILNVRPAPLETPVADLKALVRLTGELLEKDPRDRPPDAANVAHRLRNSRATGPGRPLRRRTLGAVAIAVVLLIIQYLNGPTPSEGLIAVLEFENVADARDTTRMGLITSHVITADLVNSVGSSILSSERVLEAMQGLRTPDGARRQPAAREVARRARASWIVTGSILRVQPTMLVTAELSEARTGRLVGAVRVEAREGQSMFQVAEQVSRNLAAKLARLAHPESSRDKRRMTRDLTAYRHYVEGLEYGARNELLKAEFAFNQALAQDPQFELARDQLSWIKWQLTPAGERVAP